MTLRTAVFAPLVIVVFLPLFGAAHAVAQSPAVVSPVPGSPAIVEAPAEEDEDSGRPWGRLFVFVPLAAAVGGGTVIGRRVLRDRLARG